MEIFKIKQSLIIQSFLHILIAALRDWRQPKEERVPGWIVCVYAEERNSNQQAAHYGEASSWPVRVVQPGGGEGGPGGGDQQEAVAGDHQGSGSTILHHLRCIHSQNTVSRTLIN